GTLVLTVATATTAGGAPIGELILENDDASGNADGVLVGGSASEVTLTGSAGALSAFLASSRLSYRGPESLAVATGTSLSLVLRDAATVTAVRAEAQASVALLPAMDTLQAPIAALELRLPSSLGVTVGTASALSLGSALVGDLDPDSSASYTLDLGVTTGALAVAAGGLADRDADPAKVRVAGTVRALNTWLASGGALYTGAGETLTVRLTRGAPTDLSAASASVTGTLKLIAAPVAVSPTVTLPGSVSIGASGSNSAVVFPGAAFGTGTAIMSVKVSVDAGSIGYSAASAAFPISGRALTVSDLVASSSGTGRFTSVTFTGTATRLSQFFGSDPGLNFNGSSATPLRVTVTNAARASTEAQVLAYSSTIQTASAPTIASAPDRVWITANTASDLRFDALALTGAGTISVRLSVG
ncbi:MAG: hypothetical protein ACKO8O_06385, partial [Betaproteobacteria bacterium]